MTDGVVARQLAAYNAGDVDAFVGCYAQDAVLLFVHGETGVDEQGGVLAFLGAAYGEERGEAALHGPYGGDAAGGVAAG